MHTAATKLTLSADPGLVAEAKRLAEERNTSVSALFAQFVRSLQNAGTASNETLPPLTRHALGLGRTKTRKSDKDILVEALLEKNGLKK